MIVGVSIISELEAALQGGSQDKRVETLRRVTDLFLVDASRLNEQQVAVFDDVLGHLIERIEHGALAQLSGRLAAVDNAPIGVLQRLAEDDLIDVAAPVLSQSGRLSTDDLVRIAKSKSQAHLFAISERPTLGKQLTDVLLERGDRKVVHRLADNAGAQFSETGFATLVKRSEGDDVLAQKVGSRADIPDRVFRQLILQATDAVRSRLLAQADPKIRDDVKRALDAASQDLEAEAERRRAEERATAQRLVLLMHRKGELSEATLMQFAKANKYNEMVAAMAVLCSSSFELIESLMHNDQQEVFLIPLRAADFSWSTVHAILKCRAPGHVLAEKTVACIKEDYAKLTKANAQRVLRFWQVRQSVSSKVASEASARKSPAGA
jgi:uncharacterized protein (DUF2336 family)